MFHCYDHSLYLLGIEPTRSDLQRYTRRMDYSIVYFRLPYHNYIANIRSLYVNRILLYTSFG